MSVQAWQGIRRGTMRARRAAVPLACMVPVMLAASPAHGQPYPVKPIRIVLPVAAGGNLDLVTRAVAQKIAEGVGQQVLVDNRPSAGSILGTELVARAAADGYTFLAMANTLGATAAVRKVGYDPVRDFAGISQTAWLPQILVVHPSLPVRTVKDMITLAKARPGQLSYGSSGVGGTGHMAMELFTSRTGVSLLHVPYKGNAPALVDLLGGQLSMMFDTISTSIAYVKSGRLRALGVSGMQRSPVFPEVPTIAESGVPGYQAAIFNGIVAPAKTPRDALARVHAEIVKATQSAELKARFLEQGVELTASASPEEFTNFIRAEFETTVKLVKLAGIRAE